ncbi:MAG TPA: GNAT family N-acetyltransferase [Lachnospiraceae bacterium]|nr:GNAT family N-acetyltransferase [Lachnospiraceae bacterium]
MDLLVKLYDFKCKFDSDKLALNGITIKRAMSPDKTKILDFIKKEYTQNWADESEYALMNSPISCYVAIKKGEIVGFSCYDATAKGFLGPIGIKSNEKGAGIGQALLFHTLMGMKENGYGYAIIGWVDDAIEFYRKTLNIIEIPDSTPEKSVYQNLINLDSEE